jgi:topoisomerase-4 subunit A
LPSARTQGEPLTGRFNPPAGASFQHLLAGNPDDWLVLASSYGYGFKVQLKELLSKNKAGKLLITLPEGATVLKPATLQSESDLLAVVTLQGRLLIFPVAELPALSKGKGNKLIQIPAADLANKTDAIISVVALAENCPLKVISGKRFVTLKAVDIAHYTANRAKRGLALPRGFQRVDSLECVSDSEV